MQLRYYQDEAVEAMFKCNDNGVIVLPTGSGKSLVIREYVRRSSGSILILSHIKEILEQNFNTLKGLDDIGLYSAGLNMRHIDRITVAGIQSVWNKPELLTRFDKVLVDECHLISDEGMYRTLLDKLGVQYLGLTASPFRLKQGYIYRNGLFDSLIYEASVADLTRKGYLSKLITYGSAHEYDTSEIRTTAGDFNLGEMSLAYNRDSITSKIVSQLRQYKHTRKHWLIFCLDIKHAESVAKFVNELGITCEAVHSESPRDETLRKFKAGEIQAITNVNILTIGFDYPDIDMIVIMRPTKSPTLHMQMLGRGARIADGKSNCLVKDFSGNIQRLGTLSAIQVDKDGKPKRKRGGENPFLKTCPKCERLCAPVQRKCECGHEFKFRHNLRLEAHTEEEVPRWYDVTRTLYTIHRKTGSPPCLKVQYICGVRIFTEWVLIEHPGYAGRKAHTWIQNRWAGAGDYPITTAELFKNSKYLTKSRKIHVVEKGKYPQILKHVA